MGLITLNLKRVLNWNFIFMSAVAAIFGMISLMNFGDILCLMDTCAYLSFLPEK